jgi:hypothetical protein
MNSKPKILLWFLIINSTLLFIMLGAYFYPGAKANLDKYPMIKVCVIIFVLVDFLMLLYFRVRSILASNALWKSDEAETKLPSGKRKQLKEAIKRRDVGTLWNIAQDCQERWLVEEYLQILRTITTYDPNGSYGREAKKILSEFDSAKPFDKEQLKDIERASAKLDRNLEDYDAWLELADAHLKARLYKDAREIYVKTIEHSENSSLREYAKKRLDELKTKL